MIESSTNVIDKLWNIYWRKEIVNNRLISDPTQFVLGYEYLCVIWAVLNHMRIVQRKCNYLRQKWGMGDSSL